MDYSTAIALVVSHPVAIMGIMVTTTNDAPVDPTDAAQQMQRRTRCKNAQQQRQLRHQRNARMSLPNLNSGWRHRG